MTPPQESADLVTFTEEILKGKFRFLYSATYSVTCSVTTNHQWDVQQYQITHHTNSYHIIVSHPPALQRPVSWLAIQQLPFTRLHSTLPFTKTLQRTKRETLTQVCEFAKILRTPFVHYTCGWLLLYFVNISCYQNSRQHFLSKLQVNTHHQNKQLLILCGTLHTYPPLDLLIKTNYLHNIKV